MPTHFGLAAMTDMNDRRALRRWRRLVTLVLERASSVLVEFWKCGGCGVDDELDFHRGSLREAFAEAVALSQGMSETPCPARDRDVRIYRFADPIPVEVWLARPPRGLAAFSSAFNDRRARRDYLAVSTSGIARYLRRSLSLCSMRCNLHSVFGRGGLAFDRK